MEDGRRLPMDDVQDNHPPTYDELWKACIEYENRIAKLERVVEAARELMKQSRERFGFVPIRYIRALEDALEALEE